MRFERLTHSVCADFAPRKLLFVLSCVLICSLVKTSRMRQTQEVTHAWWGLDCDLRPNEKKIKPEFQLWRFPWKARVKKFIYGSVQKVVYCSHQSDRLWYVSHTNQIAALGFASRTNQSVFFVLWFERCSNFNEAMGDSERVVRKMESSFRACLHGGGGPQVGEVTRLAVVKK